MKTHDIYIWLATEPLPFVWPEDLNPVPVTAATLSVEEPLVVTRAGWSTFVENMEQRNAWSATILLLLEGEEWPADAEDYSHAVVRVGDWDQLRFLLEHPGLMRVGEWAASLSNYELDHLPRYLEPYDVWDLSLAEWAKRTLALDERSRDAFGEAVEEERKLRWIVAEPTAKELNMYVQGKLSRASLPHIEAYLERNPGGRATVELFRRKLRPVLEAPFQGHATDRPAPSDLEQTQALLRQLEAYSVSSDDLAAIGQRFEAKRIDDVHLQALLTLIVTFLAKKLWIARLGNREPQRSAERQPSEVVLGEDLPAILLTLLDGNPVRLAYEGYAFEMSLATVDSKEQLIIDKVQRQSTERSVFIVELRTESEVLWGREKGLSKEGRVMIPLIALQEALGKGATHFHLIMGPA